MLYIPEWFRRAFWSAYGSRVWDQHDAHARSAEVERVVRALEHVRGSGQERVLDAGCGTGEYSLALARQGFRVQGIDSAEGMLQRARAKCSPELVDRLAFANVDLNAELPFPPEHFQFILLVSVLQSVRDPLRTLTELRRVLSREGTLLLLHSTRTAALPARETPAARLSFRGALLVRAKRAAERAGATHQWTEDQLCIQVERAGFVIRAREPGRMLLLLAARAT